MNVRKYIQIALVVILVAFFSVPGVSADPPVSTAPTIDGTIGSDWVGKTTLYPSGTWFITDPANDSLWGTSNEIKNIYINWDATYLYLGFDFDVASNGFVAYIDFNDSTGITNFNAGYAGAWPRLVSFPASNGIDFFYGVWNDQTGNVYVDNGSNNSTDITSSCTVAKSNQGGTHYHAEVRCPWSAIGYSYSGTGLTLNLFAAIVGGDNYGGADVAPSGTINPGSSYQITVSTSDFKQANIGHNAVTLTRVQARTTVWPFAAGAILLLGVALLRRKQ